MLAGWITFGAVQGARGLTVAVVFLVIVLRREDDQIYAGDMTQEFNLYIGLSRVRDVLHIFIQDLRPALQPSPSCSMQASRRNGEVRLCQLYTFLEQQVWAAYNASAVVMQDAYAKYSSKVNWRFETAFLDGKYFARLFGLSLIHI